MVNALSEPMSNKHSKDGKKTPHRWNLEVSDDLVDNLVKLFKLLSDETRLRILYYLTQRSELHVRCASCSAKASRRSATTWPCCAWPG